MTTSAWPERLTCRRDWTDIELPDPAIAELRAALDGRREPSTRSRRTSASTDGPRASVFLLLGPDRAQKRIVAEAVARELRVDLYRIDLSAVLFKWIGDTGRHLAQLFDRAENGRAVLLFDEADPLFARAGGVKDSHDRYANLAGAFLLELLAARGCIALITARRMEIDPALERGLSKVIRFPAR